MSGRIRSDGIQVVYVIYISQYSFRMLDAKVKC